MGSQFVKEHQYLYHYTNADGLHGIIRSQQIWATNIRESLIKSTHRDVRALKVNAIFMGRMKR